MAAPSNRFPRRAMELGRECLNLWGYERVDEIIWVKTNQLQRIIRTGRTGHWLNHGKEHCLVSPRAPRNAGKHPNIAYNGPKNTWDDPKLPPQGVGTVRAELGGD
ncbi:hypothetical protein AV530_001475 [Patagioenas fasciata monilis]|uniref:mRNA m(6)A methyltransferase n=1 Tax=Patagioenas fasciata monilis TaxID=372326 RepID=A0A1V4KY61_PATFA|nr:hypothetical protein AV530_001475 [Patagioenas fasciata monilis]